MLQYTSRNESDMRTLTTLFYEYLTYMIKMFSFHFHEIRPVRRLESRGVKARSSSSF